MLELVVKKVLILIASCFLMVEFIVPAAAAAASSASVLKDSRGNIIPQRPIRPDDGLTWLLPDDHPACVLAGTFEPRGRSTSVSAPSVAALALSPTGRALTAIPAGSPATSEAGTEGGYSPRVTEISYEEKRELFFMNMQKRSYYLIILLRNLCYEALPVTKARASQFDAFFDEMEGKCNATPAPSDFEKIYAMEFKALRNAVWRSLPAQQLDEGAKTLYDTRPRLFIDDTKRIAFRLLAGKVNYFIVKLEEAYDYPCSFAVTAADLEKAFPSPRCAFYEEGVYEAARYSAGLAARWS